MPTDMYHTDAASYAAKIKQLLDSTDRRTLALAFQLMQSLGKPDLPGFSKLVSNGGLKIAFCLRYGLAEYLLHLDAIYLIDEPLEVLPPEIGQLRQLEELEIRRAGIRHLPRQLAFLKKLQRLNLAENALIDFPSEVMYLSELRSLDMSQNQLREVHDNVAFLAKLRAMYLANNHLQELPLHFSPMKSLGYLDLRFNQIRHLPVQWAAPPMLRYLDLRGNPIDKMQVDAFKKAQPQLKVAFSEY